jgi:hypothetical protein
MMLRMSMVATALSLLLFGGSAVLSKAQTPVVQDTGGHHSADDARLDELTKEIGELRRVIVALETRDEQAAIRQTLDKLAESQSEGDRKIREDIRVLRNMVSARR